MTTPHFVHLRVKSDYSLGVGASKVKKLIERAAALGQPALALTDEENLHGAAELSKAAKALGVQPILGTTVYLSMGKRDQRGSLMLLARDARGYANICEILKMELRPDRSVSHVIDANAISLLLKRPDLREGIICISGSAPGSVGSVIFKNGGLSAAVQTLDFLKKVFYDGFFVEICRNDVQTDEEIECERAILQAALQIKAPIVATSDVWYATPDRHDAFLILKAVTENTRVSGDKNGIKNNDPKRYHLRSTEEMCRMFSDIPEAVENTLSVAKLCSFSAPKRKPILPPFISEKGLPENEEMRQQAKTGLEERLSAHSIPEDKHKTYFDRLEFELSTIERMGFSGYFLIVSDFIKWAISQGIPVGPGRGSGAGSVVAWSLKITDLDPMRYGLLFERFLNPDRVSMPDFDIDFCQDRREEVIHYVKNKYGEEKVAQIVTFMVIKSKSAIKDVARVVHHPELGKTSFGNANSIADLIPKSETSPDPKSLKDAYDTAPAFRDFIRSNEQFETVYKNALEIEGLNRNSSAHAAGVIIGGSDLTTLVPVGFDAQSGFPIVQLNMKDSEDAGLVKFDFLGLKTLSVINEAVKHIKATAGVDVDFARIDVNDFETYEMLASGKTNGVFQLESDGMKKAIRDIRPTRIEDLIAIVSLYRPGPMDMIPKYARCKNGLEEPEYPEPRDRTKPFLEETFGIMIYQEQVMQVAQTVAGYSLGEADLLRRAMGKKIKAEMDAQKEKFVRQAVERGAVADKADELFNLIEKFAGYGFNKSHAAAYAYIAFQTAWLKCHYPVQFFSALMTYEVSKPEKLNSIKQDMDHFNLKLLPPSVNHSHDRFWPELSDGNYGVRFGLTAIKGISSSIAGIVQEREARGPFKDLGDFFKRYGLKNLKSDQVTTLAAAGAFDDISPNKNRRYASDTLTGWVKSGSKSDNGTIDLFGDAPIIARKSEEDTADWQNRAEREFAAVGFFIGDHPLDLYYELAIAAGARPKKNIETWFLGKNMASIENRKLYGMIEAAERTTNEKGTQSIRVRFSEKNDSYWIKVYPRERGSTHIQEMYHVAEAAIKDRRPVIITCKISRSDDNKTFFFGTDLVSASSYFRKSNVFRTLYAVLDPLAGLHKKDLDLIEALNSESVANPALSDTNYEKVVQIIDSNVTSAIENITTKFSTPETDNADVDTYLVKYIFAVPQGDAHMRYTFEEKLSLRPGSLNNQIRSIRAMKPIQYFGLQEPSSTGSYVSDAA